MPAYSNAPVSTYNPVAAGLIPEDVFSVANAWFPNRTPLTLRFHHEPLGSETWRIANSRFRARSTALTADINTSVTAVPVTDATLFDVDDVIQIDLEFMLVSAITDSTHLAVTRAYAGTTAASHTAGASPVFNVTNTRSGNAENIATMSPVDESFQNTIMTIQTAYAVGGRVQALGNYYGGAPMPLAREKMAALQRVLDQFESGIIYSRKVLNASSTTKTATAGLLQQIVTNATISPTNADAYKPLDLVRDLVQPAFNNGGEPTHLLMSTDWLTGFATWGFPLVRADARETELGIKVRAFNIPFLDGSIQGVICPLMRAGTAVLVNEAEIAIRMTRELTDKPQGSRGDAERGDIIMEGGIEVDNESHHAWVAGVTGFASPQTVNVVVNVPETP